MEINQKKTVKVNATTLSICLKVSDCFNATLKDAEGEVLKEHEGYVPGFMPGEHYGDYVMLEIEIDTGQITNWKKINPREIEQFIEAGDADE